MTRIALVQMQAKAGDVSANLARIAGAARQTAEAGASLLVAPELALTGYGAGDAIARLAEPTDGAMIGALEAIAAQHDIAILAGFPERAGATVYNSAAFVGTVGHATVYRKSHLYGDYERALFAPARPSGVIVEHAGLKFGLLICYDVEFPENVRRLAKAGAQAVLVPTALPAGDHAAFIARQMIAVRAFENQIFLAYANHCGADALFTYAGLSQIAAPDGTMLAGADAVEDTLLIATIDPSAFAGSAAQNTYLRDMRDEL
ncbi:carbon-nitrogen hydrolase family protein [Mesorhizobium xinjiangense]|uniref:carbon-nitrogen hydrolase family protein n=1 Tax=Mesorhizobium xinjiangense TaxID=2678685 RepID=UPI0012EE8452|nr:carbon-nitrogen hydrolase family protein [Mesorhizobium xinjiangense]